MHSGLKNYLHKKANQMNLHIVISEDEIKMYSAKPSQYIKIMDILVGLGYPPKSRTADRNPNGEIIDILII